MSGDQTTPCLKPSVLWAQRPDCLYVTIRLSDVKDKVLNLKDGSLYFKGKSGTPKLQDYEVDLEFYGKVDPENSRQLSTDREIVMYIKKSESENWPRLLSDKRKFPWLHVDFNHWVDENESESEFGAGGMDPNFSSMLSKMSNFNDYGGEDADIDSDDEDLPDLEPVKKKETDEVEEVAEKPKEKEEPEVPKEIPAQ